MAGKRRENMAGKRRKNDGKTTGKHHTGITRFLYAFSTLTVLADWRIDDWRIAEDKP
jgi:hypothetical protein